MQVARQCFILLFFKEARWDVKGIDALGENDNIPEIDENKYYILSKLRKDMQTSLANAVFKHVQTHLAAAAVARAEQEEADAAAESSATAATYVGLPMDVDLDLHGQPTGSMESPDKKTSVVRLRDFVVKNVMAHPNLVMLHPCYEFLSKKVSAKLCNFLTNEHHDLPSKKWIVGNVVTCVDEHFHVEWLVWLGSMIQQYVQANGPDDDESQALSVTPEQQDAIDTLTAIFGIKPDGDTAADTDIDEELMYATLTARTQYIYTVLQTLLRSTTDLPTLDERLISKLNIKEKQVAEGGGSIYGFWFKAIDAIVKWRMSSVDDNDLNQSLTDVCNLSMQDTKAAAKDTSDLGPMVQPTSTASKVPSKNPETPAAELATSVAIGPIGPIGSGVVVTDGGPQTTEVAEPPAETSSHPHDVKASFEVEYIRHVVSKDYNHSKPNQLMNYLGMVNFEMGKMTAKQVLKQLRVVPQQQSAASDKDALPWTLEAKALDKDVALPFFGRIGLAQAENTPPSHGVSITDALWGTKTIINSAPDLVSGSRSWSRLWRTLRQPV